MLWYTHKSTEHNVLYMQAEKLMYSFNGRAIIGLLCSATTCPTPVNF